MMKKPPHQVSLRAVIIVAAVVFAVVAIAAIFFATQFFAAQSDTSVADDETKRIMGKVESLYMLPQGRPTVAKVQNKEKLDGQAFFDKVENGDYLVVYSDAKLALLYRESTDKLVNVGPIALDDTVPEATSDPMSVDNQ